MDFSLRVSKKQVAESDSRDRLSELPDSLIFVILSLLQMRDVVRTTLLSKRWKNRWDTMPCLDFNFRLYDDIHTIRSFICGALSQWKGAKIMKFSLDCSYSLPRANDLDSWLRLAIGKQVEELSICLGRRRVSGYCPPQLLYSCSSITKLSLSYFKLKINKRVQWDQLKSLTIKGSKSLSEEDMNKVLSGAPRLEELILFLWEIRENFNIRSTSLKILRICKHLSCYQMVRVYSSLRIWAPNLLTLEIAGWIDGSCLLHVPSLTHAVLYFLECGKEMISGDFSRFEMLKEVFQSIRHVDNVTLSNWCTKFLLYVKKKGMLVQFSNAKVLKLYTTAGDHIDEMLALLEMFPMLIILRAELRKAYQDNYSFASMTPIPSCSLIHLKTVDISCWYGKYPPVLFQVIEFLLENAQMLEKMVIRLSGAKENSESFILALEKVLSMRRASPYAKVIISKDR